MLNFYVEKNGQSIAGQSLLVVCTNATGSLKIFCAMITKQKNPGCIKGRTWPLSYFIKKKELG